MQNNNETEKIFLVSNYGINFHEQKTKKTEDFQKKDSGGWN